MPRPCANQIAPRSKAQSSPRGKFCLAGVTTAAKIAHAKTDKRSDQDHAGIEQTRFKNAAGRASLHMRRDRIRAGGGTQEPTKPAEPAVPSLVISIACSGGGPRRQDRS